MARILGSLVSGVAASTAVIAACQPVAIATGRQDPRSGNPAMTAVSPEAEAMPMPTNASAGEPPIFLEVTTTTRLAGGASGTPPLLVGSPAYVFLADKGILLLPAGSLPVGREAEVLIGFRDILQTTAQSHEDRRISAFPGDPTRSIEIVSLDAASMIVVLRHDGRDFALAPGEKLRLGHQNGAPTHADVTVTVMHHGRLADIQPLPPPGSGP